ncbi:MAG: peroxiredoxin [Verrucomicrobiae bacterium]|nr:peroxiredoxin [Verrucomicrobiae bacterium]
MLLYFYPKDDTSGCTKQACGYRDLLSELGDADIEVVGISFDTAESHRQFRSKYNLNFRLIVDTEGKIADAYGARATSGTMARRVSFLIGLDGKIAHITDNPNADVHLKEVKEAIAKLTNKPKG